MSEEMKLIEARIEAIKESIHFFSNEMKPNREIWVVNRLLDYLKLDREQDEVKSSTEEPVDVVFRDGSFQIKEVLDKNRRRGSEYLQALETTRKATKGEDLFEYYSPIYLQIKDALVVVADQVNKWSSKYPPGIRKNIDLLFYINFQDVHIEHQGSRLPKRLSYSFERAGWRSITVVENECAFVVFASETAPYFIRKVFGSIFK